MTILIVVLGLGLAIGMEPGKIVSTVEGGFGKTIGSIGIVILLGCLLGKVLEETGAAVKITNSVLAIFGRKNTIWAIIISSAILGIPVFADSVVIVLMPIVSTLALKVGASMAQYGTAPYLELTLPIPLFRQPRSAGWRRHPWRRSRQRHLLGHHRFNSGGNCHYDLHQDHQARDLPQGRVHQNGANPDRSPKITGLASFLSSNHSPHRTNHDCIDAQSLR